MRYLDAVRKVRRLIDELKTYRDDLIERHDRIVEDLKLKYPYDAYGIKGQMIIEEKTAKLDEHIKKTGYYIRALENAIWSVEDIANNEKKKDEQ